ncbi:MAG: AmmeMemoRadiSam system protein B [Betaproteobacteria bacterium]|nr:AmmeMemoRadiSam system protein B [Betaproteobacteria bacterium]
MPIARSPAVAGAFYPADPAALRRAVHGFLATARPPVLPRPKALMAPHAGYVYSGPVAASAYALLTPLRGVIRRVVLLGPVHRVWTPGLALPDADAFDTPLGRIPLDREAMDGLADLPQVRVHAEAHAQEHSLEVHLPFLQESLEAFTLIPLAVGGATPEAVAEVLDRLWGGDETLIVVSSDLSHFLDYAAAQQRDDATVRHILHQDAWLEGDQACGCHPLNGLLLTARRRGLQTHLLDLRNSGDTAGERARVVGYASIAFTEPGRGDLLLRRARAAIAQALGRQADPSPCPEWMRQPAACFVTLTLQGRLRGCIGSLQAHRALNADLEANARAAAFNDPRFPPLTAEELGQIRVEVSLLTAPEPMRFSNEADALAQLRPGVDGVILEHGWHRATFLPQVWEQLPDPVEFMAHLKQKAGLEADFWAPEIRLSRYQVEKFREE